MAPTGNRIAHWNARKWNLGNSSQPVTAGAREGPLPWPALHVHWHSARGQLLPLVAERQVSESPLTVGTGGGLPSWARGLSLLGVLGGAERQAPATGPTALTACAASFSSRPLAGEWPGEVRDSPSPWMGLAYLTCKFVLESR